MRRAICRWLAAVAGVMIGFSGETNASADALPPCWRGQTGSTVQTWRFDTGANPAAPELVTNPNGVPSASVAVSPVGAGWLNQLFLFGTNQGVWDLGGGGSMALTIPNEAHPSGHWKLISVQVYQFRDGGIYNQIAPVSVPGATRVGGEVRPVTTNVIGPGLSVTWVVDQSLWLMETCPASESVVINAPGPTISSAIDAVVVDTICLSADNGDVFPPCWRGNASASYQSWSFHNSSNPMAAEQTLNTVSATANIALGPFAAGWQASDSAIGCRNGFWDLGSAGAVDLNIQRAAGPSGAYSYVQVQVTQFRDALLYNQLPNISLASAATMVSRTQQVLEPTVTGEWIVDRTIWRVPNCSATETVTILAGPNGALIDQAVVDTLCVEPPVCPVDITVNQDSGQCSAANISWAIPVVDHCTVLSIACTTNGVPVTNPATFPVGQTAVNCVINDAENQPSTCVFHVTVLDVEAPVIATCAPSLGGFANALCLAAVPDFTGNLVATDCSALTVTQSPVAGTLVGLGTTPVLLTVTDGAGNAATCPTSFVVTDNLPPTISTCPPTQNAFADASCQAAVPDFTAGVVASDCNLPLVVTQSPLAGTLVGLGSTVVTLTVTDAANNTTACLTSFVVTDNTPPLIVTCSSPQSAYAETGCQAAVPDFTAGVVATDCNLPLAITQSPLAGTLVSAGATTVTITVTDGANNTTTCTSSFTVSAAADLSVLVVASPNTVTVGQPVSYTVTVTNAGPCDATGVTVNRVVSAGQVLASITDPGTSIARACLSPGSSTWWRAEGNASDSIGVNHGAINGGVAFGAGQVNQSFSFDGIDGYVSVPDSPALRPSSLTVEGWIKVQDPNGLHVIVSKPRGPGTAESYSLWIGSGVLYAAVSDGSGSGPFMSYPEFPGSSTFLGTDIVNLPSLAAKLKVPPPGDGVSLYLSSQLSLDTQNLLSLYAGGADPALLSGLISDLNQIIQAGPLYDGPRFAGVTLSAEASYVLARNPLGTDLVRLNRLLVRDAYPTEIASVLFPQLNQWHHVAYTYDAVAQVQALYVNGNLVDNGYVNKTITYDNSAFLIGSGNDNGVPGFFYQGAVDELSLYDRALVGIEVQAIHGAGADGKCFTAGPVGLGTLATGASQTFTIVTVPTNCPTVSVEATVTSTTTDLVLAFNTATGSSSVQDIAASLLQLTIRRVSLNNNHVEITWPQSCAPYQLEGTFDLNSPILWTPMLAPVQILNSRYSTVIPAADPHQFFRLKSQ